MVLTMGRHVKWIAQLSGDETPRFVLLPNAFGYVDRGDAIRELCARHCARAEKWMEEGAEIEAEAARIKAALDRMERVAPDALGPGGVVQ